MRLSHLSLPSAVGLGSLRTCHSTESAPGARKHWGVRDVSAGDVKSVPRGWRPPGKDFPVEENCEVETKMLVPVIVFSALVILLGIVPGGINSFISALAGTIM